MCDFERRINLEIIEVKEGKIYDGKKYSIEAYELEHGIKTVGYRFVEKDKVKIKVSAAEKLGIPEGPLLGELQEGKKIKFKGKEISPEEVTYKVKGKIIAYIPDSVPGKNTLKIAQDADILITDSTFSEKLAEKAEEHMHLTAKQAANIANQANAKKLILTHFSTRYKDTSELRQEAEEIFPDVVCAEDFMKINL
jgi:ribonuclease Z